MNIYEFLMFLVKTLASLGPVKKEDAYNAIDLVKQLERMNAFGELGRITTGRHLYQPSQKQISRYHFEFKCGICGKDQSEHE